MDPDLTPQPLPAAPVDPVNDPTIAAAPVDPNAQPPAAQSMPWWQTASGNVPEASSTSVAPIEAAAPPVGDELVELPALGSLVAYRYFDVYDPTEPGGREVTKVGIVTEHHDDRTVTVAWLDNLSTAMPADELTVVA